MTVAKREEYKALMTDEYITWLRAFIKTDIYVSWYNRFLSIKRLLKGMEVSEERNSLLDAERKCIQDWKLAVGTLERK